MKIVIAVFVAVFVAGAAAQCPSCATMKWAKCDGPPCVCTLQLSENLPQQVNCSALVPKCWLMKTEMYRARTGQSTRSIGGKPVESAFADNDGIYDPICENDGKFKAKQCNNTDQCWCVNSAGVRRTDKGDVNIKCDKLVETYWVRLQLTHKPTASPVNANNLNVSIANAISTRYMKLDPSLVKNVQYDPTAQMIVVDVEKPKGDRVIDLPRMAYYMEKDVKVLPLFVDQSPFTVADANGQTLQMDTILVYYVDEEPPTFTMKNLSGGIIAVIVVVVLAVVIGLLALFFTRKRLSKKYNKAQQREMDPM